MTPDQIRLLRIIRRSAAVLIALSQSDQPVSARQLSNLLDLDYSTVRAYLAELIAADLVERVTGGFLSTDLSTILISRVIQSAEIPRSYTQEEIESAEIPRFDTPETRKNRASGTPLINTIIINTDSKDKVISNKGTETRKNRANADNPLWEALARYGILPNSRTIKLELSGITADTVHQVAKTINKPFPKYAGLLIRALEHALINPPVHPAGCICDKCRSSYVTGEFAEFIN